MYSFKNARFHDEIRKWNTEQLIEALKFNGLEECCHAIQNREIDGETFLNLTEGQLAFWKNQLSMVQIRRLWSHIQLAQEKPQQFIPQSKTSKPEAPNKPKIEKIKSPIANSLEKVFGQQINPTPPAQQVEVPEGNYPNVKPGAPLPKPGALPPKPANLAGRRPPPPPGGNVSDGTTSSPVNASEDRYRPPVPPLPDASSRPPIPPLPDASSRPPVPVPQIPSPSVYPKPPIPSSYPKPKPPGPPSVSPFLSQYEDHAEEVVYEDEPMTQASHLNDVPPLPPANPSALYQTPPTPKPVHSSPIPVPSNPLPVPSNSTLPGLSNPIPIRRPAPSPNFIGRPLPTPPEDEPIFPLPPNVVPLTRNGRSPIPPELPDLPRPPVFLPPPHVPDFHSDDEEQPEYDAVDEAEIPEYRLQPWFRDIDRKQAATILRGKAKNGSFIVRPSTKPENECTFTVINDGKIYNLAVEKVNGKLVLGKNMFDTVTDIVERFVENPMVLTGLNGQDIYVTLLRY